MYCKNCDLVFDEDLKFCTSCAGKLIDPELMAILPENERDSDNIPDVISRRLRNFNNELLKKATYMNTEFLADEDELLDKLKNSEITLFEFESRYNVLGSDENSFRRNKDYIKLLNEVSRIFSDNYWVFEAADYINKKNGKQGVDFERLKYCGIDLRDLNNIIYGDEKMYYFNKLRSDFIVYSSDLVMYISDIILNLHRI